MLYLAVRSGVEAVQNLRDRVFAEPLARTLTWPFHPHVTVHDGGQPERLHAAVVALAGYRAEVTFDRVHLLQEGRDQAGLREWRTIADAALRAPAVVGRGGLELDLAVTAQLDPEARAFREHEWAAFHPDHARAVDLAVTARRDGRVVGTATGWTSGPRAHLAELIVAAAHRREGIGAHLAAAFLAEAVRRDCSVARTRAEAGGPAEGFWRRLGWMEEARLGADGPGHVAVQLRRDLGSLRSPAPERR